VLRPTYAVPDDNNGWSMLVQVVNTSINFDELDNKNSINTGWYATPQAKFERLLREKEIPIGIICNGIEIRLVYAPRGESSGHLTFPVPAMYEVSGRLILGAMHMLLECDRVFGTLPERQSKKKFCPKERISQEVIVVSGGFLEGEINKEIKRSHPSNVY
jgi:hypothetical protein